MAMKTFVRQFALGVFSVGCLVLFTVLVQAEEKRAMSIVDLLNVPALNDPGLSPDGNQLLYVLSLPDWKENRRIGHIWRINADGSNPVQMTNGEKGEGVPRWSPDGSRIASGSISVACRRPGCVQETRCAVCARRADEVDSRVGRPVAASP